MTNHIEFLGFRCTAQMRTIWSTSQTRLSSNTKCVDSLIRLS
jgi:hypothetical protein